jgi:hypothetical protein
MQNDTVNTGTGTQAEELYRLTSEDTARALSPDAGWSRPPLTREQQDELLALIKPALLEGGEHTFRIFVNRIFDDAVNRYIAFRQESPRTILRDELRKAAQRLGKSGPDRDADLPPDVVQALDARLQEDPSPETQGAIASALEPELSPALLELIETVLEAEIPPEVRANGSFARWLGTHELEHRRRLQLEAIRRITVEVKRGPSNTIDRLMVRGLVALVHRVTGTVPTRIYRAHTHSLRERGGPVGEDYWFLDLATKLAQFVNQALPPELRRPGVAALTGIVAEELKALRESQAAPEMPAAAEGEGEAPPG